MVGLRALISLSRAIMNSRIAAITASTPRIQCSMKMMAIYIGTHGLSAKDAGPGPEIYCWQACACAVQSGNWTGWGSERFDYLYPRSEAYVNLINRYFTIMLSLPSKLRPQLTL